MAKSKLQLRFPNIILLLCGLILLIFLFDFLWRNVLDPTVPGDTENIIMENGDFATTNGGADPNASATTEESSEKTKDSTEEDDKTTKETEETTEEDATTETIHLAQSQIHNGPLILVSGTCPFIGDTDFVDFSGNTNYNIIPRDTSLQVHPDMMQPISDLFDGYCMGNGYVNLQIYSTSEINAAANSLYTNVLTERSTGYTFDIGLITSTGDVVAYLTKRNEWMFNNCWYYGFVVRYQDTKTGTTGVGFMPHHFRYVGIPHSMIMYEMGFCLEEYLYYLTDYTMETKPLTYETSDTAYEIYYIQAEESGDTTVTIPKGANYTVSGNNTDGFILTIEKDLASKEPTTEGTTDASSDATEPQETPSSDPTESTEIA